MDHYTRQSKTSSAENDFYATFEVKVERLITALYMVTNFFSDREPMKWQLRDAGLRLLSESAALKDKNTSGKSESLVNIIYTLESIITHLEIARLADFISDMNYTVLTGEFVALKIDVEQRGEVRGSVAAFGIPKKFFTQESQQRIQKQPEGLSPLTDVAEQLEKRDRFQPTRFTESTAHTTKKTHVGTGTRMKDVIETMRSDEDYKRPAPGTRVEVKRNKRRDSILALLQDKPELSIKDIKAVITDCSEKTIQRELVAMVNEGVLKKTGERRWSKYSLNI